MKRILRDKYDLAILGQGSAAFAAAIRANELGVRTVMIGGNETKGTVLGGTCVNVGCVPSKNLITVGAALQQSEGNNQHFESISYGKTKLDFAKALSEKERLVRKFRREKYQSVLDNLENVEYIPELARFVSSQKVRIGKRTITAEKFLIATGARAKVPSVQGLDSVDYLTNEEALSLKKLPGSMIVSAVEHWDWSLRRCTPILELRLQSCREAIDSCLKTSPRYQTL